MSCSNMCQGDLHDSKFNEYARTARLADLLDENINGLKLNQDVCEYVLTVYPSDQMYSSFITSKFVFLRVFRPAFTRQFHNQQLTIQSAHNRPTSSFDRWCRCDFCLHCLYVCSLRSTGRTASETCSEHGQNVNGNCVVTLPRNYHQAVDGTRRDKRIQEELCFGE